MRHALLVAALGAVSAAQAATFTVTNLDDSGPGSLRDAIAQANATPDADTINFAVTGTITLTSGSLPIEGGPLTIGGPNLNPSRTWLPLALMADAHLLYPVWGHRPPLNTSCTCYATYPGPTKHHQSRDCEELMGECLGRSSNHWS